MKQKRLSQRVAKIRDKKVVEMFDEAETMQDIAEAFKITVQQVFQIIKTYDKNKSQK